MFVVPSDEELIQQSAGIVVGVSRGSYSRQEAGRAIETVTRVDVVETLRGESVARTIEVVSPGGVVGDLGLLVPGAAKFRDGERVLLFLDRTQRGDWTPRGMTLGKFSFTNARLERAEVCGFDNRGNPHVERSRSSEAFLHYVRERVRGRQASADYFAPLSRTESAASQAVSPRTYVLDHSGTGLRWASFPSAVVFKTHGHQPHAIEGGLAAVRRGLAAWTDEPASNIVYHYAGTTEASSAFRAADGVNSIIFNDPANEVTAAGVLAAGGVFYHPGNTHRFGGETYITVIEADLVIRKNLALPGVAGPGFDRVITHELGHTLALRHSDEAPAGGATSRSAIMNSVVGFHNDYIGASLQTWDREAVGAVYGSDASASPHCGAPEIVQQPLSTSIRNEAITLVVGAMGAGPLQYQWYVGSRGDTSSPIANATSAELTVQPSVTTRYWVRVSGSCPPFVDSVEALVTVNGCPTVQIASVTRSASVMQGSPVALSAGVEAASRLFICRWYQGERGDRSMFLGTGETIVVLPQQTTRYWAEVTNDCGVSVTSETIVISVHACTPPRILVHAARADAVAGEPISLAAAISGSDPMRVQWYEGRVGDATRPVRNAISASTASPPIFTPTQFWARAENDCGVAYTEVIDVGLVGACTAPEIVFEPRSVNVAPGTRGIVSIDVKGPSLTYRWYQGARFDYSRPVGVSSPHLATTPIDEATQFWVEISSPCGAVASETITVTPSTGRRRAAGR